MRLGLIGGVLLGLVAVCGGSGCRSANGQPPGAELQIRTPGAERSVPSTEPEEPHPPTARELMAEGDSRRAAGEISHALWSYLRAHQLDPDDPRALRSAAELQLSVDPARGVRLFEELLREYPESGAARTGLGLALLAAGRDDAAEVELRRALELESRSAVAHNAIGVLLDRKGRREEARRHLETAIRLSPQSPVPLNNLGVSRMATGEFALATEALQRAVDLGAREAAVLNNLGISLGRTGRYDEALAAFRRAGTEQAALNNLGYVHYLNGDLDSALEIYERALLAPGDDRGTVLQNIRAARRAQREGLPPSGSPEEAPPAAAEGR